MVKLHKKLLGHNSVDDSLLDAIKLHEGGKHSIQIRFFIASHSVVGSLTLDCS